jgi:hypothetical protein
MKNRRILAILLAITLFLAGCTAEDLDEDEDEDSSDAYNFEGSDSAAAVTDGNNDDLLDVLMVKGEDIAWSKLKIEMDNRDADPVICLPSDQESSSPCTYDEDDSQYWSVNESITIKERNSGVCSGPESDIGGCEININIIMTNPDEDEIIIGEITVTAQ